MHSMDRLQNEIHYVTFVYIFIVFRTMIVWVFIITRFPCIDLRSILLRSIHGKTPKIDLSHSELVGL